MSGIQSSSRPGPVARSCLTCRHRRKKCDRTVPRCERCIKAKMECLGYDNLDVAGSVGFCNETLKAKKAQHAQVALDYPQPTKQDAYLTTGSTRGSGSATVMFSYDSSNVSDATLEPLPSSQLLTSQSPFHSTASGSLVHLESGSYSLALSTSHFVSKSWRPSNTTSLSTIPSVPKGLSTISSSVGKIIDNFVSRYEQLTRLTFFRPMREQIQYLCRGMSWYLEHVDPTHRITLLCIKIIDHMLDSNSAEKRISICQSRLGQLEQEVASASEQTLGPNGTRGQLASILKAALFQVKTTDGINTYQTLRRYAPIFLQVVFSDPTLWPGPQISTLVSLAQILASDTDELSHFVVLDMFCSMAYGLPQVLEYETLTPLRNTPVQCGEWIHGCPPEIQMIIVETNARYLRRHIGPVLDFGDLEQRVQDWRPTIRTTPGEKSWRTVARLTVQESWRHTVLIYLYMVACGVMSDDPRVRSSVRQVFQIIDTVKHKTHFGNGVHFLMQYLIAGACTPSEKHRALVRAKLSESAQNWLRMFNMSDFVRTLDHLWCGAGANGRPIRWSDYVCSRQAVIPVFA